MARSNRSQWVTFRPTIDRSRKVGLRGLRRNYCLAHSLGVAV